MPEFHEHPGKWGWQRNPHLYAGNRCLDCGEGWPGMFMLHDALWLSVADKLDRLCLLCTEDRLGRKVTWRDLKPVPITTKDVPLVLQIYHQSPPEEQAEMDRERRYQFDTTEEVP